MCFIRFYRVVDTFLSFFTAVLKIVNYLFSQASFFLDFEFDLRVFLDFALDFAFESAECAEASESGY